MKEGLNSLERPTGGIKKLYAPFLWRNLPPCEDIVKLLSKCLDEKLSLRERLVITIHLHVCRWCVNYKQQVHLIRVLTKTLANLPEYSPSDVFSLSAHSRDRIKRLLVESAR